MKINRKLSYRISAAGGIGLAALALACVLLLASASMSQSGDQLEVELKAAMQKELVDGNLNGAIAEYKSILTRAGANRTIAAKALVQMGQCYEKLGNAEAQKAYQQVVRDYADQAEQVKQAQARLAALKSEAAAPAGEPTLTIRRIRHLEMGAYPSPDGKFMAYGDGMTGNLGIVDAATGAKRLLTNNGSWGDPSQFALFMAWSRDSKRIAFGWKISSAKEDRTELRVVPVSGAAAPVTIATPGAYDIWPIKWSRDGSRILCGYQVSRGGRVGLGLVSVNTTRLEDLNVAMGAGRWLESQFVDDDNSILYSNPADGKAAPNDIYMRNLKTGATTVVVQHPAEDLLVGVVPGTDWLLFASNRRGRLDLWGVQFCNGKTDGTPVLVKQGIGRFYPLGFTDDGRYYYATISVTDDVFLADFNPETGRITGEPRKLASRWEGVSMYPSFSPDGEYLAYVAQRSPMPIPVHTADSLVVQSLKDTKADPVVVGFREHGLTNVAGPCWTDDGRSIILYGSRVGENGLYRIDLPSRKATKIYSGGFRAYDCASHGRFVYVAKPISDGSTAVTRFDIEGGNATELYKAQPGRISIAVSPDGKTLSIIQSPSPNHWSLLLIPPQGGAARKIHEFDQPAGGGVSQTWAPDGKSIFYITRTGPDDRVITRVSIDGNDVSEQHCDFGRFFGLQFSQNGRSVAFTGRSGLSTDSVVWVIENLKNELKALLPTSGEKP